MRRSLPLALLLVLPVACWATMASAQPQEPGAPPSAPSASPAPPPPPAPAPTPPPQEFEPDPASRKTPHWYGWQPMIFDAAAGLQAVLAYTLDQGGLYATAAVTYFVGPVSVHLYHGRVGNVVVGAGSRIAGPGLGAVTGYLIDKAGSGGRSNGNTGSSVGVGIGCLVAAIVDDAINSHEMLQFWEVGLTVSPTITRESRGLSLSGSF